MGFFDKNEEDEMVMKSTVFTTAAWGKVVVPVSATLNPMNLSGITTATWVNFAAAKSFGQVPEGNRAGTFEYDT